MVKDQDIVRTMVCEILVQGGYDVLATSSGEEALRLFSDAKLGIKLLLTDVIMTGMNGPELYRRLSGKDSGMKGLFMSGYSSEILSHEGVLRGGCHIIQKPLAPRDLLRRLREVLDRETGAGSPSLA
ncbi:MAG TPA: response regulator [Candidatus Ozemobacteraceae bacterium]|nr:response regulator [Candidatus Ozemobacteraceae bacterium]HQG28687.1 response regulator [Candidatus Ozemobacteraceae bacterium]